MLRETTRGFSIHPAWARSYSVPGYNTNSNDYESAIEDGMAWQFAVT
jgi:hypothetical protein